MENYLQQSLKHAEIACKAIEDKLGQDIVTIDIHEISTVADYFVIASANNVNQVRAIADFVDQKLFENGARVIHSEGYQTATWVLLDFGTIIVHVFNKEERQLYNLEKIWGSGAPVQFN